MSASDDLALVCAMADELAGAVAFGALPNDEARLVADHLARCPRPHPELRTGDGAGLLLIAALEPVAPSDRLRARVMASVATDRRAVSRGEGSSLLERVQRALA